MVIFEPEVGIKDFIDMQLRVINQGYNKKQTWQDNLLTCYGVMRRIPEKKKRVVIELPQINVPEHLSIEYEKIKNIIVAGGSLLPFISENNSKLKHKRQPFIFLEYLPLAFKYITRKRNVQPKNWMDSFCTYI